MSTTYKFFLFRVSRTPETFDTADKIFELSSKDNHGLIYFFYHCNIFSVVETKRNEFTSYMYSNCNILTYIASYKEILIFNYAFHTFHGPSLEPGIGDDGETWCRCREVIAGTQTVRICCVAVRFPWQWRGGVSMETTITGADACFIWAQQSALGPHRSRY